MLKLQALGQADWIEQAQQELSDIEWCNDGDYPVIWFGEPDVALSVEGPVVLVIDEWERSQLPSLRTPFKLERLLPWNLPEQPLFGSGGLLGFEAVHGAVDAERWLEEWVEQACRLDEALRDRYFTELKIDGGLLGPVLHTGLQERHFGLLVTQQARAFGALREAIAYFEPALIATE